MIFNTSLRRARVPAHWKAANIISVPNINPPRPITSDLRPIALTATLEKVMESFVGNWIVRAVENNLEGCQYRGLKRQLTTHALIEMLHHWHSAVDKGQCVHAVFVNFAKAFSHVDHNILVAEMPKLCHTNKYKLFLAKDEQFRNSCIPYCVAKFWQH